MKDVFVLPTLAALIVASVALLFGVACARAETAQYKPAAYVQYADGWRFRDTRGWDSSCFNLPYLSSQFACDAR